MPYIERKTAGDYYIQYQQSNMTEWRYVWSIYVNDQYEGNRMFIQGCKYKSWTMPTDLPKNWVAVV